MIHPDEALRLILNSVKPLPAEEISLERADGHIAARTVRANCDLPPFDNSAMDGYAVRSQDLRNGRGNILAVRQTVRAGRRAGRRVAKGEACRIMTGAPMPKGADSVVMREKTEESPDRVKVLEAPERGQHIRVRGTDVRRGQVLVESGVRLRPAEIGLLAAQGVAKVRVFRRPRVALLSSGDEIVDYRRKTLPGQIRNSSAPALAAALREAGFTPVAGGIARDDKAAIRRRITAALRDSDALFVIGGVSVGDYDHTREVLDRMGFREIFWRTRIRPGKPLLYGTLKGKPVFGLPGNPNSSWVCARVFAFPALDRLAGNPKPRAAFPLTGVVAKVFRKPKRLRHFLFCDARREGNRFRLKVIAPQGSALLKMASHANALAVGPIGVETLEPGMEMRFAWL